MVAYVETGDLRSLRNDADDDGKGHFTVQCNDVPLASLRRKPVKQKSQTKKVRLTPINEELDREKSFTEDADALVFPSTSPNALSDDEISVPKRSGTPGLRRQSNIIKILSDVADAYEEELENIPEEKDSRVRDPGVRQILRDLPPRPKCRRKVLPPSVTGVNDTEAKRSKLLKRRSKQNIDRVSSVSPLKDPDSKKCSFKDLQYKDRPRSAESGVRVISLSDLSSVNSSSVPDLPSIINKLSKSGTEDFRGVSEFDDSGALSTPRRPAEPPLGPVPWDNPYLKGNEISSFYNMWERDRTKRPFDKKESKEQGLKVNRSCLCSIRQWGMKKCGSHPKKHFLPPLH